MQKWQQTKRKKAHESIIENAKSSFRRSSNSRQKPASISRVRPIYPHNPKTKPQVPINKILEIFQLQQYSHLLTTHKFVHGLAQLGEVNSKIDDIMQQVQERDKERFSSLLHTLIIMSRSVNQSQKTTRNRQRSKNSISYPPQPVSTHSNKTPPSIPKSINSQSKFRIKTKNMTNLNSNSNSTSHTPKYTKQQNIIVDKPVIKIPIQKERKKSISHQVHEPKKKAADDLSLIHHFEVQQDHTSGQLKASNECNSIIRKLAEKLSTLEPRPQAPHSHSHSQSIQLQLKKIGQMYLSFDSATLTSNITNIDLQQLTQCLALEIMSLLAKYEVDALAKQNEYQIKSLLQDSFVIVREEEEKQSRSQFGSQLLSDRGYADRDGNQIEIEIKEELSKFRNTNEFIAESIEAQIQLQNESQHNYEQSASSMSQNPENVQIKLKTKTNNPGLASSIWGNNYLASAIEDFSCFDTLSDKNQQQSRTETNTNTKTKTEDVKNFIDLVMMGGKMEKQIPILALIYINRLLQNAPYARITHQNWKNIVLITLIEASKIWDDRSLENHSFSKVIHPYTTLQLNRLEKYLLFFIDYRLNISQKQYSQAYFALRKHSGQPCHTVNLIRLDLRAIRKLEQANEREEDKIEKREFMRKCMNKSF